MRKKDIVGRGDLRLIAPSDAAGEPRLGLVLNVDVPLRFSEIALVHPYPELATSVDGVVPGVLPYDVVIQTDLRGVVWTSQVSRLVGKLSPETINEISDLVDTGRPASAFGIRRGIPLAGLHDRRWSFKADEGEALRMLTSDCTRALIR